MKCLEGELELESGQTRILEPIISEYETCTPNARRYIYTIVGAGFGLAEKKGYDSKKIFSAITKCLRDVYVKDIQPADDKRKIAESLLAILQAQILRGINAKYKLNFNRKN